MKKKFGMTTGLLMIVVLLVSMAIGAAGAKYVSQEQTTGQVTITADIGTIVLQESQAVRQPSGAYTLDTANPVAENSYVLIPGLDIPKDPHVVITKQDANPTYAKELCALYRKAGFDTFCTSSKDAFGIEEIRD